MAASPPTDVSGTNTDGEMSSEAENDQNAVTERDKDETTTGAQPEEPFKKPAVFAVPSLSSRRHTSNTTPAKKPENDNKPTLEEEKKSEKDKAGDTVSDISSDSAREVTQKRPEKEKNGEKEKRGAAVKPRQKLPAHPGKFPPLPYSEPLWAASSPLDTPYSLEILKDGSIVDTVPLTHRSYFVVGRLPVCDVSLEHPSISRYHAVIQYRGGGGEGEGDEEEEGEGERGFYVHDLGSTHGTVVNKNKIPPKTFIRLRVGHVIKFGGSTRLFILQGPEFDEEEESELTVTELRERARKQKEELEKRMMGDGSDGDDDADEREENEGEEGENTKSRKKGSHQDSGCSWGMAEEAAPEEDENEENPFSTEFQEDQEAAYLKDPKKALQGFYDREGEELEFEYEDKNHGSWLCRIKLPVDDALGRQLVAEVTHTGKKKEAAIQCCLEACRMLEARGLLRQEAVSRKRKKKNWEDEDYYDSDDDTFLDRTGTVEKKRQERMKKAGKIEERPETYDSLVSKLAAVEKELTDTQRKLNCGKGGSSASAAEDSLDAFMTAVKSEAAMDGVERRKLHLHVADLRKEAQRLRKLVELTRPAQMPSLQPSSEEEKPKKSLPLFGAMKGGSKFKLRTGTIGKLPPKRPNLPAELFNMKELPPGGEVEEEEEDEEEKEEDKKEDNDEEQTPEVPEESTSTETKAEKPSTSPERRDDRQRKRRSDESTEVMKPKPQQQSSNKSSASTTTEPKAEGEREAAADPKKKKKVIGPSRPPVQLSEQYPDDDPDYSVWMPPAGQTGDGRTHLNDKFGY